MPEGKTLLVLHKELPHVVEEDSLLAAGDAQAGSSRLTIERRPVLNHHISGKIEGGISIVETDEGF